MAINNLSKNDEAVSKATFVIQNRDLFEEDVVQRALDYMKNF